MDRKFNGTSFKTFSSNFISWEKRFVVLYEGYFYIYNSETANKPIKLIDLCSFDRVEKVENFKAKDVAWPFKVVSELTQREVIFGSTSQTEQKSWIEVTQAGIIEAEKSGRRETLKKALESQKTCPEEHPTISTDPDDEEDVQGIYDSIDNIAEESERTVPSDKAEYVFCPTTVAKQAPKSRKGIPMPPTPENNEDNHSSNSNDGHSKVAPTESFPIPPRAMPKSGPPPVAKKPPPAVPPPVSKASHLSEEVEYEVEDDLFMDAFWTGAAEAGIQLLKSNLDQEGVFMVRNSTSGNGGKTLQVVCGGAVKKYQITQQGTRFLIGDKPLFDNLSELLKFYQSNNLPNYETKLSTPFKRAKQA